MAQSIFTEDFESAASVAARWKDGTYTLEKTDRGMSMRVDLAEGDANKPAFMLDAASIKGKKVTVSAWVKAERVSAKPKAWNGIKVMLHWIAGAKKDWPQASIDVGTFDWRRVQCTVDVPAETTTAYLYLGLESVTGTAWFDDVTVTASGGAREKSYLIAPKREDLRGTITIDASVIRGKVNPLIFGHNLEAADGKDIFGPYSNPKGKDGDGVWDPVNRAPVSEVVQFSKDVGMKMLRYPGGCLVHNFDWKKTVGPVAERPEYAFGIDEYIEFCRAVGAEPLMNVAVYVGTPEDKAELVEYCNAPATPAHPWAMKRAAWGHKEPYGIQYFEIGNEEDHGNHDVKPFRKFTVEQYADYYLACVRTMKAVDPSIKMSVHMGTGTPPSDPWNAKVMSLVKEKADFVAVHTYIPPVDDYMRSTALAAERLAEYRDVIRKNAGKDIPLAVTEFNTGSHELRFSYGAAFFSADYVRHMLEPENNILMAHYWHFLQGFWGFIRRAGNGYSTMPAYHTFRLWGEHFGSELIGMRVDAPTYATKIANLVQTPELKLENVSSGAVDIRSTGAESFTVSLNSIKGDAYPEIAAMAISPASMYRISFKARVVGDVAPFVLGLGVMDRRGWNATKSAIGIEGIETRSEWYDFVGEYATLSDATEISLVARIRGKSAGVNAKFEVKDLRIVRKQETPYALLSALASRSEDGKTLAVMLFNKSPVSDITVRIAVSGASISRGKLWQVNAESLVNPDPKKETAKEVKSGEMIEGIAGNAFTIVLPAHSMTAVNLR